MARHKSMICVGGPRAGQRYTVMEGGGFRVPILKPLPFMTQSMDEVAVAEVEYFDYREELFHTPEGDVSFWVPARQTLLETITMLLETYEQAKSTAT